MYLCKLNFDNIMSQKSKQIIGKVLLLIFAIYYVNITLFTHSHTINGVTIVHSHIHNKAHAQTGTHTASELTLISALSTFQSTQAALFFAGLSVFFFIVAAIRIISEKKIISTAIVNHPLRAPPYSF